MTQSAAMDKLLRLAKDSLDAFSIMAERVGLAISNHRAVWQVVTVEKKESVAKPVYTSGLNHLAELPENGWQNVA